MVLLIILRFVHMALLLSFIQEVTLWAFVVAHQLAVYYVACVLVEQLPPPDATSGKFYKYVYSVTQVFAANWRRTKDAVKA